METSRPNVLALLNNLAFLKDYEFPIDLIHDIIVFIRENVNKSNLKFVKIIEGYDTVKINILNKTLITI